MAQPWQFLGYQKLASNTAGVYFTNWFPAGTNASSYWDFNYKLVMETVTNYSGANGSEPGPYYRLNINSVYNWDVVAYSQHDDNQASGTPYQWSAYPTATTNGRPYAFEQPSTTWIMNQGTNNDAANGTRRYASGEDDTQWGTTEVSYTKQHSTGHSMRMNSFNVQSRVNGTNQCFNGYQATCGTLTGYNVAPAELYINAANWQFLAGSKFWLWGCRTTNDY